MSRIKWAYSWEEFVNTDFSNFGGLLSYINDRYVYNFYQEGGNYYILEQPNPVKYADIRQTFTLQNTFSIQKEAKDYFASKIPVKDRKQYSGLFSLQINNRNLE